jgi:hypothetical protein
VFLGLACFSSSRELGFGYWARGLVTALSFIELRAQGRHQRLVYFGLLEALVCVKEIYKTILIPHEISVRDRSYFLSVRTQTVTSPFSFSFSSSHITIPIRPHWINSSINSWSPSLLGTLPRICSEALRHVHCVCVFCPVLPRFGK